MQTCDFSYNHYCFVLKKALQAGFAIINFCNLKQAQKKSKIIVLRHDVDYAPHRALEMAKIEKSLNVKATYFVRVHGQHYHPFDKENFPIFKKIIDMGHEIGLHTEARDLAKKFKLSAKELFQKEKEVLENIFDIKVASAAEHGDFFRPQNFWQKKLLNKNHKKTLKIKHIPDDFKDFEYISDSCGKWKKDCICSNLEKFDKIQLLTHPDHWGEDAKKEMRKLIKIAYPDVYSQITRKWKI